jgi:hypothetical protein
MRIIEVAAPAVDRARLTALAQFLTSRAKDTDARQVISVPAFLKLAQNMQIALTGDQLRELIQQPPLSNIITNIEGDNETGQIVFRGAQDNEVAGTEMSVDQARKTVDSMAKRAIDIK